MTTLVDRVLENFAATYGTATDVRIALAPGRINLIGEHTDYNDGFVLPMAIDRYIGVGFRSRDDDEVRIAAPDFRDHGRFNLAAVRPGTRSDWTSYVSGVLWALQRSGFELRGMDLVLLGELPIGAGLSSSAAVEMAIARAACAASDLAWDPVRMAELGRIAERDYVGVSCGIMDQLAASLSAAGCALLIDCRTLDVQLVPIPQEIQFVIMDTGVRRTLGDTAYNDRVAECQAAVSSIRRAHPEVRELRDVTAGMLRELAGSMDTVLLRRAWHVVEENDRPLQLMEAFQSGNLEAAGRLMNASHRSLRERFEASCPELDAIVGMATAHPACFGARLTGAGFGGCAIAAVDRVHASEFIDAVASAYQQRFGDTGHVFACNAAAGAHLAGSGVLSVAP